MSIETNCVSRLGNSEVNRPYEAENVPRGTVWVGGWVGGLHLFKWKYDQRILKMPTTVFMVIIYNTMSIPEAIVFSDIITCDLRLTTRTVLE